MLFKWGCFLVSEKFVSGVLKNYILPLIFEYHPVLCTRASYEAKRVTRGEDFKETKLLQLMPKNYVIFDVAFFFFLNLNAISRHEQLSQQILRHIIQALKSRVCLPSILEDLCSLSALMIFQFCLYLR